MKVTYMRSNAPGPDRRLAWWSLAVCCCSGAEGSGFVPVKSGFPWSGVCPWTDPVPHLHQLPALKHYIQGAHFRKWYCFVPIPYRGGRRWQFGTIVDCMCGRLIVTSSSTLPSVRWCSWRDPGNPLMLHIDCMVRSWRLSAVLSIWRLTSPRTCP